MGYLINIFLLLEKYVWGFIIVNVYFYIIDYCMRVLKFIFLVKKEVNVFFFFFWECFYGGIKVNKRFCIYLIGKWLIKLVLLWYFVDDILIMLFYMVISIFNLLKKSIIRILINDLNFC